MDPVSFASFEEKYQLLDTFTEEVNQKRQQLKDLKESEKYKDYLALRIEMCAYFDHDVLFDTISMFLQHIKKCSSSTEKIESLLTKVDRVITTIVSFRTKQVDCQDGIDRWIELLNESTRVFEKKVPSREKSEQKVQFSRFVVVWRK